MSWIQQHRLAAFFGLAYAISWAGWPLYALGIWPEPLFLPCGPVVAAVVVVALSDGAAGFRALGANLLRWRVGWRWYAVAVGLPVALVLATAVLNTVSGAPLPDLGGVAWTEIALVFAIGLVNPMNGGFGEEPGWRAYALPLLQRDRSPLASAAVLGVLVAGWHVPLVAMGLLAPIGLVSTVVITFLYVWLFNRTGGSALIALVFHAVQDAFTIGGLGYAAADAGRAEWIYCVVLVLVVAGSVALDRAAWRDAPRAARWPTVAVPAGRR